MLLQNLRMRLGWFSNIECIDLTTPSKAHGIRLKKALFKAGVLAISNARNPSRIFNEVFLGNLEVQVSLWLYFIKS